MLSEDDLMTIDGWERDHYGDHICEWVRHLDDGEAHDNYGLFALVVQEDGDVYNVSISVAPGEGQLGDLLSADYQDTVDTVEEAMERGRTFVEQVEDKYDLN